MAFPRAGIRPNQLFFARRGLSRRAFASSAALHAGLFALVTWGARLPHAEPRPAPMLHLNRAHAVHYLALLNPEPPKPRSTLREHRPVSPPRLTPVPIPQPSSLPASPANEPREAAPREPALLAAELPPGSIAGVGPSVATAGPDAATGPDLYTRLGFRRPQAGGDGQGTDPRPLVGRGAKSGPGISRVAELMSGAGSACPELRRPAGRPNHGVAVAIAFVVDTSGAVDPATVRVVESPDGPRTEHRFYSHVYAVSTTARVDGALSDVPAGYDSLMTEEVASHVRQLRFRPALQHGSLIRSTVLVSCQSPDPDDISIR